MSAVIQGYETFIVAQKNMDMDEKSAHALYITSLLSDAQELIDLGSMERANQLINAVKEVTIYVKGL